MHFRSLPSLLKVGGLLGHSAFHLSLDGRQACRCIQPRFCQACRRRNVARHCFRQGGAYGLICFGNLLGRLHFLALRDAPAPRKKYHVTRANVLVTQQSCHESRWHCEPCLCALPAQRLEELGTMKLRLCELAPEVLKLGGAAHQGAAAPQAHWRQQNVVPLVHAWPLEEIIPLQGVDKVAELSANGGPASQRPQRPEAAPTHGH
mmetsp:Transcript_84253/g.235095  ORF Transcript_84253/g.235095 Transcript_84253/m.235095 type:complete len:205 (+) Transcript_84253:1427-2041(+)